MLAVWECRFRNRARIGSYLDQTFSFDIRPTISRKLLSAFETQVIHRQKTLPRVTSCNPHQREKRLKHLPRSNWTENASSVMDRTSSQGKSASSHRSRLVLHRTSAVAGHASLHV